MAKLKDTAKKTLTIKVTPDLYERVRQAREAAREEGKVYNVSESVAEFLERDMKRVYKELGKTPPKKTSENQPDMFPEGKPKKTSNNKSIRGTTDVKKDA